MANNNRVFLLAQRSALGVSALALLFGGSQLARAQDTAAAPSSTPPTPAQCGISGHHALLERMTEAFVLTCPQELKLEPLLHDEESVSKPLLRFAGFTPEEKKEVMQEVKVAARKQIRPLLTPEQQAKMDQEIDTVSKGGEGLHKGGGKKEGGSKEGGAKKGGGKKTESGPVDPFEAEQSLSQAINNYSAFTDAQKKDLTLRVKKASRRQDAPAMTPEQAKMVDAEIQSLSSPAGN
jgi:hypothetical protein